MKPGSCGQYQIFINHFWRLAKIHGMELAGIARCICESDAPDHTCNVRVVVSKALTVMLNESV
jgi:hypothetical protein